MFNQLIVGTFLMVSFNAFAGFGLRVDGKDAEATYLDRNTLRVSVIKLENRSLSSLQKLLEESPEQKFAEYSSEVGENRPADYNLFRTQAFRKILKDFDTEAQATLKEITNDSKLTKDQKAMLADHLGEKRKYIYNRFHGVPTKHSQRYKKGLKDLRNLTKSFDHYFSDQEKPEEFLKKSRELLKDLTSNDSISSETKKELINLLEQKNKKILKENPELSNLSDNKDKDCHIPVDDQGESPLMVPCGSEKYIKEGLSTGIKTIGAINNNKLLNQSIRGGEVFDPGNNLPDFEGFDLHGDEKPQTGIR